MKGNRDMVLPYNERKLVVAGVELKLSMHLHGRELSKIVDVYAKHIRFRRPITNIKARKDLKVFTNIDRDLAPNEGVVIRLLEDTFEVVYCDNTCQYWQVVSHHIVKEEPIPEHIMEWIIKVESKILSKQN